MKNTLSRSDKINLASKELKKIQSKVIAKKPLTSKEKKMSQIAFAFGRVNGAKEIVKRGII